MNELKNNQITKILKALGDETRYQIIKLLGGGDFCVGALAQIMNTSRPAVSQHLKILREAGLVRGEKRGYWTHYIVDKEVLCKAAREIEHLAEGRVQSHEQGPLMCLRQHGRPAPTTEGLETDLERRALQMCEKCCEQLDKLKMKPEECTPEQKKGCHGDMEEHPCECGNDEQNK